MEINFLFKCLLLISGRSSSSSLNNAKPAPKKDISVSFKKVSINDHKTDSPVSTPTHQKLSNGNHHHQVNGSNPSIVSSSNNTTTHQQGHRPSLIHASIEKKAKKVRFFINSDKFFKGATIAVSSEKFRTFDKLLEHMTRIMCNQVTLPHGVRYIFGLDGKTVETVEELLHGSNYVCSR